jgi:hypothetical protein
MSINRSTSIGSFMSICIPLMVVAMLVVVIIQLSDGFHYFDKKQTNTVTTAVDVHQNVPGLSDYREIGWRPVVGEMNKDPESGVHYVIVSINGRTNDILSQRVCYINLGATSTLNDFSWYDEATLPPVWKVYVVSRRTEPMNQTVFFVKNDATNPKYNLIPTKK